MILPLPRALCEETVHFAIICAFYPGRHLSGGPQSRGLGTASLLQSLGSKKDALLTIQCPAKVTKVSAAGKTDCCGSTFIKLSFPSTKALRQKLHRFTGK